MKRSIWPALAVPALLLDATLVAQILVQVVPTATPAPRAKFGGSSVAPAARANPATGAGVKTDLGMDAALSPELQIKRLQKRVAELSQLTRSLQLQIDSLNSSLEAIQRSAITYRCESGSLGARSVNSLGVAMECSPYSCDATTGRCFRPPCATSVECGPGTACDVGGTNLCVSP